MDTNVLTWARKLLTSVVLWTLLLLALFIREIIRYSGQTVAIILHYIQQVNRNVHGYTQNKSKLSFKLQ